MPSFSTKKNTAADFARIRRGRATRASKILRNAITSVNRSGANLGFVPRSMGNPRAITERKYFDAERAFVAVGATTASWAGGEYDPTTLNTLFAPVTGDDFLNRTGRKVQVLSIKIRGYILVDKQADQTGADAPSTVRILLVQDKQTNAAQLNAEDVINSGAANTAIHMFQNPSFFGRFKVLKDKTMTFASPSISYDGTNMEQSGLVKPFKMTLNFKKPVVMHFNSTNGGTVADIIDNSFHLIAGADIVTLAPQIAYKVRTTFIDL